MYLCLQEVEFGCGRAMSDVSSMFIVYLLELQTWYQDTNVTSAVLQDLWPHAKLAAEWQMNISNADKIPIHLQNTYDILGLNAYRHSTYSGAFHLLAMLAAERLAYQMGKLSYGSLEIHCLTKKQEVFLIGHAAWELTFIYLCPH